MDKQQIKEQKQKILDLLRPFCTEKLNEEYFEIAEKLVQKLGRKRNVPFATGQAKIWAAAVIHAIGTINFLFDKSFEPYLSVDDINDYFGTNKSTTGNKSKQVRDLLKLAPWDPEFSTRKMQESNPMHNYVMVDGFMIPLDSIPEQYQQLVRQARAEGRNISFTTR